MGGRKVVYDMKRTRFIVPAKGRKEFEVDLKGEGVKVFKWKFR